MNDRIERLKERYVAGELTLDEFEARVETALEPSRGFEGQIIH